MGLGQACRCRAESNGQLGYGIGAKSLNRDLSEEHTYLASLLLSNVTV